VTSSLLRSKSLRLLGYTNNELTREQSAEAITLVASKVADGSLTVAHETVTPQNVPVAWAGHAAGTTSVRSVVVPSAV